MCAAEGAVDFQEFPIGDAQQADRGRGFRIRESVWACLSFCFY